MGLFIFLLCITVVLYYIVGCISVGDYVSTFTKCCIFAAALISIALLMRFVVNDYQAIEKNGTIPDTTITIKNGVADTVAKYIINYEGK